MKTVALCAAVAVLAGLPAAAAGPAGKPYRVLPVMTGLKQTIYVTTRRSEPDNLYIVEKGGRFDPDKIADVFWELHAQSPGSFEAERVLR